MKALGECSRWPIQVGPQAGTSRRLNGIRDTSSPRFLPFYSRVVKLLISWLNYNFTTAKITVLFSLCSFKSPESINKNYKLFGNNFQSRAFFPHSPASTVILWLFWGLLAELLEFHLKVRHCQRPGTEIAEKVQVYLKHSFKVLELGWSWVELVWQVSR